MTLSVSELVTQIKAIIDENPTLQQVSVQGEISNLTQYRSGHWYFSLKDDTAKINCVMFSRANARVSFKPKDGDKIMASGNVSVYVNTGQLQFILSDMKPAGLGDLHARYLELRDKLHKQGYFDQSHKKLLPKYPLSIGVIAGANSAALADIQQTLKTRWPIARITVYPSLVQGNTAPSQLIMRLQQADKAAHDVIILARGGGSLEDLWAFNDEGLVHEIFKSQTPIVSGVGHEIDVTLVDYVVDQRGLTPTAAAQLATPDQYEVYQILDTYESHLTQLMKHRLSQMSHQLNYLANSAYLRRPKQFIAQRQLILNQQVNSLRQYTSRIEKKISEVKQLNHTLVSKSQMFTTLQYQKLAQIDNSLNSSLQKRLQSEKHGFALVLEKLNMLSPLSIMSKGYLLSFQEEQLIHSKFEIDSDKLITLQYHDGKVLVRKAEEDNE
ncbi:MAG: exodeoxyribonuclease VII large subunit [Erysipelothrix sp.]|nr:exodeoxyribonuclease VII large subunit [Erysipelothrix sp.]